MPANPNRALQTGATDWLSEYGDLIRRLPGTVADARLTICGMSACVDARVSMHELPVQLDGNAPAEAVGFIDMLLRRVERGIGGEIRVEWPGGPDWLAAHAPVDFALGGTGPHAAYTLTSLGAPALVALQDRSAHMLAQFDGRVLLAEGGRVVPANKVRPRGESRPDIFIFEYTAGNPVGSIVPSRSSRIIVRFADLGLEEDSEFDRLSLELAPDAGAGLISGFNCVPADVLPDATRRIRALASGWRDAGLATVHLELAGYDTLDACRQVLGELQGGISSVGMSHSEFLALTDSSRLGDGLCDLGDRLGVDRICVHADHWAAAATRQEPELEREALMTGCLVASARAANGRPVLPDAVHPAARFSPDPFPEPVARGPWALVSCAAPFLPAPVTTLGLGDTFTGGCLLVLGKNRSV